MVLFSDLAGNLMQGYMSYIVKFVLYAAVAAIGITIGIRLRKKKNSRESE